MVGIGHRGAIIADVAYIIPIAIFLAGVGHEEAIIVHIEDRVTVDVVADFIGLG